jgi:hypothetical protein
MSKTLEFALGTWGMLSSNSRLTGLPYSAHQTADGGYVLAGLVRSRKICLLGPGQRRRLPRAWLPRE